MRASLTELGPEAAHVSVSGGMGRAWPLQMTEYCSIHTGGNSDTAGTRTTLEDAVLRETSP